MGMFIVYILIGIGCWCYDMLEKGEVKKIDVVIYLPLLVASGCLVIISSLILVVAITVLDFIDTEIKFTDSEKILWKRTMTNTIFKEG